MADRETRDAIQHVVRDYVEGMCQANVKKLHSAMMPDAHCVGHFDGGLEWLDRAGFCNSVTDAVNKPELDPWYQIEETRIAGDIAFVHVVDDWLGMRFDDYLTLLKHDGSWRIASKLFYLRADQ